MTLSSQGRLLAVDVGERRHGIARSDPHQRIAQPLTTLEQRAGKRFPYIRLEPFLTEVTGIVVGLPLTPEGTEGEAAIRARKIAALLERRSGLPVVLWDERHTTALAQRAILEMGGSTRGRKGEVDQLAATVLLQSFLEARRCTDG